MAGEPDDDDRVRAAWRSWLSALATDAEAAAAAALAYESLPDEARDAWLDALEVDATALDVPTIALYAPLLAVEGAPCRRERIERVIAADLDAARVRGRETLALRGVGPDGTHACVVVSPLYLDFVHVLTCRYTPANGFIAVRHEPLRHRAEVGAVREIEGISVEPTPLRLVVEELAHAILADKRAQRTPPSALASFAHLFAPVLDDDGETEPRA
jgi:hypothetical protein